MDDHNTILLHSPNNSKTYPLLPGFHNYTFWDPTNMSSQKLHQKAHYNEANPRISVHTQEVEITADIRDLLPDQSQKNDRTRLYKHRKKSCLNHILAVIFQVLAHNSAISSGGGGWSWKTWGATPLTPEESVHSDLLH